MPKDEAGNCFMTYIRITTHKMKLARSNIDLASYTHHAIMSHDIINR